MEKLLSEVTGKWGQLDVLVNCAGVMDGFGKSKAYKADTF